MDDLVWIKARAIEELVLEHGHDLKELIAKELESMKGENRSGYKCNTECAEC